MRLFTLGAIALGLSVSAAAEDTSRNDELVNFVDQATIQFVSESLDHSILRTIDDGVGVLGVYTDATTGLDIIYGVQGKVCDETAACVGLEIFVIYEGQFSTEITNDLNQRWSAIKATLIDGNLHLTRYLILDRGQTIGNLRTNVMNTLAISELVDQHLGALNQSPAVSEIPQPAEISFGDDSGDYAGDGACDDARFDADGDNWSYQRAHVMRDATDCRAGFEDGTIQLYLYFGTDEGDLANNGTCEDSRFTGDGRSEQASDAYMFRDATDCVIAYQAGTINRPIGGAG